MTTAFSDGVIGAIRLGAIVGLCTCGFLLYRQVTGSLETLGGCEGAWTCEEIFNSKWGKVFGIPVVVLAVATYVGLFVLSLKPIRKLGQYSDVFLGALGVALLLSSLWFVGLQLYYRIACTFCLLAQFVGVSVGGIILKSICEAIHFRVKVLAPATFALAVVLTAGLIAGHFGGSSHDLSASKSRGRADGDQRFENGYYKFPNLALSVERGRFPTIGNPKAEKAVVILLDYATPSSQRIYDHISALADQLGDELAIILIPVPLDKDCNEHWPTPVSANACQMATYAYAAWEANPRIYQAYHNFLMRGGSYSESGSIAGTVWHDANSNGLRDPGEKGISNVKINLYRTLNLTAPMRGTTNEEGQYVFSNLPVGMVDMRFQLKIHETNLQEGGALENMINTAGSGEERNASEYYELTSIAATQTGKDFGFVETARYNKISLTNAGRDGAKTPSSDASHDPFAAELFRLAGDEAEAIAGLLPDFSTIETTDEEAESREDWRDLGNPVLERLVAGTTIYGDLHHVSSTLPSVIFGADQVRSGTIEESPKEFAAKVRAATGLDRP